MLPAHPRLLGEPSLPPPRPRVITLVDDDEVLSTRAVAQLAPHPRTRAVLTQMTGLDAGRVFSLGPPGATSTLGRDAACTHAFDEASLSRVHLRVLRDERDPAAVLVEDHGSTNGVFVNEERVLRARLHDGDRLRLGSVVTLRFQMVDELEEQALLRVFESSVKDGLTGAWNRKYLDERLHGEVAFAARHHTALSVVLVDVDHFKKVNDSLGHLVGDRVLRATAEVLRSAMRTEDLLARYGGEEFVVLARNVDLRGAVQLAERLRVLVERQAAIADDLQVARTISAGVASLDCCGAERTATRLLDLSDARLYAAKEGGRNRVVGEGAQAGRRLSS